MKKTAEGAGLGVYALVGALAGVIGMGVVALVFGAVQHFMFGG